MELIDERIRDNRRMPVHKTASEIISEGKKQCKYGLRTNLKYFILMEPRILLAFDHMH
jgi:hypothetical protein